MANIAVLGAGSWGTALALQLARNQHDVTLWAHRREHAAALAENRENRRYLPGIPLPPNLAISDDLAASVRAAELVLAVVPSRAFAGLLADLKPHIQQTPLMWAIKGFEAGSGRLLTDVFMETLGEHPHAILAGPSFAKKLPPANPPPSPSPPATTRWHKPSPATSTAATSSATPAPTSPASKSAAP